MYFRQERKWQKQLIKDIAKKYGIDIRVVRQIVYYPFLFTKHKIIDSSDEEGIRHRHLGMFVLKGRYKSK